MSLVGGVVSRLESHSIEPDGSFFQDNSNSNTDSKPAYT